MKLLPGYIKIDALKAKVLPHLQEPRKMRIVVILGIGFLGLGLIGLPMRAKMHSMERQLLEETQRHELITGIQRLKSKDKIYKKHLNEDANLNWWVEYIIDGSREHNLKVLEFKPFETKGEGARPGTYEGVFLQFRLAGDYFDLSRFARWIEDNKWSMRITRLIMQKERKGEFINANMSIAILVNRLAKGTDSETETKSEISAKISNEVEKERKK